jgi:two-component system sensor histidine kinase DevS
MQRILLDIADLAPLEEVADRLARAAVELTDAEYGALGVYASDGNLERFVTVGMSDEEREGIGDPPTGAGLLGEFARSGTAIRLDDIADHASAVGPPARHPPMGPFLGVPVIYGEQVLGAFYVSRSPGAASFGEDDEAVLSALAPYAAIAMSNAVTLERERYRADSANVIARAANEIQAASSDEEVCSALLVALHRLAPQAIVLVQLDDEEPCEANGHNERLIEQLSEVDRLAGPTRRLQLDNLEVCVADGGVDLPVRIAVALAGVVPEGLDDAMRRLCDLGSAGIAAGLRREAEAALERYAIRDAIARDLHDDLIQSIYAIGLGLRQHTDDPAELKAILTRTTHGLSEVIRDLRSYIAQLSRGPDSLTEPERLGLRIETLLDSAVPPPEWKHEIELGDDALTPRFERQLYLIVREAVSNVHRHAAASRARLSLTRDGETLYLEVGDDGRGYDRQTVPANAVGLRSIEERVADLGGSVVMDSSPSEGTTIRATFPIGSLSGVQP